MMVAPSHAPSTRLGACDPCRAGDHAGCDEITVGGEPCGSDSLCTCYDDGWEWHEEVALAPPEPIGTRIDLGGGMVVPLAELLEDDG